MFRIGLKKFPCNGLTRVKKHGCSKLHLIARYHESRTRVKYEPDGRLYKDIRLISRFTGPKYSTKSSKSEKNGGSGTLITLGGVAIGTLGILTYAKRDPEVRATLEGWFPGTDKAIRIIFQEESSYFESVLTFFRTLKEMILDMFIKETEQPAPKPAFKPLVEKKEAPINEPYTEIRVSQEKGEKVDVVVEKPTPPKIVPEELMPQNLVELETYCGETAAKAIAAYHEAECALREYNQDVFRMIESSTGTISGAIWHRLKDATEKRKEKLQQAEEHAKDALNSLKRMYNLIDEPVLQAPAHMKTAARRNVRKIMDDVDEAKRKYTEELHSSHFTDRFWKKIKKAREDFNEELQILFPKINIYDKKMSVSEEDFDLFVLHMYHKVNDLQKELEKLKTIEEAKIKAALKATGDEATQEKLDALICLAVKQEKLELQDQYAKELLVEQKKLDDEMRRQLKLQSEIHADHLRDALLAKEQETQRMLQRDFTEQSDADSIEHKKQLAAMTGRLRGLTAAIKAKGDALVCAAIQSIPEEAAKRGVIPEDVLRERFLKVESMARRLAMVPEEGAALPIYFLSYLQSFLIIKTVGPIPKTELEDEPIDVSSLNTYDILQRARYWLDRGNFQMTLKYMNLLKGAPRSIAKDWMNETRILLETQQAINTLLAYAGAIGLTHLGVGDQQK
ncbi:hypothetical protein ACFW04_001238 [Cataglyphis niger]